MALDLIKEKGVPLLVDSGRGCARERHGCWRQPVSDSKEAL